MALRERCSALAIGLGLAACGGPAAPAAPSAAAPMPAVATTGPGAQSGVSAPATSVPASSAPNATARLGVAPGRPCGNLGCLAFATPRAAFEHALAGSPRVVAVGEAHAQKAVAGVESATARFARELLPALAPRVKGIVIELLAPDRRCEAHDQEAVAERTKPVTEPQRETNQSEFVALGFAAKKLGIQAQPLIPTCDELKGVLASDNDVGALLELIANVTLREASDFLAHQPPERGIAIYGGLLHNDVTPSADHATWSFGPRLFEQAHGSYVEIDLIVPELIQNDAPWTNLAWFSQYGPASPGHETVLYQTAPASFVLIFPRSEAARAPGAAP